MLERRGSRKFGKASKFKYVEAVEARLERIDEHDVMKAGRAGNADNDMTEVMVESSKSMKVAHNASWKRNNKDILKENEMTIRALEENMHESHAERDGDINDSTEGEARRGDDCVMMKNNHDRCGFATKPTNARDNFPIDASKQSRDCENDDANQHEDQTLADDDETVTDAEFQAKFEFLKALLLSDTKLESSKHDDEWSSDDDSYYSDDSFITIQSDTDSDTDTDDTVHYSDTTSDSAIGLESFCVNPFFA